MVQLHETSDTHSFILTAVHIIADGIKTAIEKKGHCILGLSGGTTPGPIYKVLAKEEINWGKVKIFLSDERRVALDHKESNVLLVRDTFLSLLTIAPALFMYPDTTLDLPQSAESYHDMLHNLLKHDDPDVLVLGLGHDGHTASLFPPVEKAAKGPKLAMATHTDLFPIHERISITFPVIERSELPLFLLKGPEKRAVWTKMSAEKKDLTRWPAQVALETGRTQVIAYW